MRFSLIFLFVSALFCVHSTSSHCIPNSCSVVYCINHENSDISSALLCNDCLRKISNDKETVVALIRALQNGEYRVDNVNNNVDYDVAKIKNVGPKKLGDLNVDVLLLIFDDLSVIDMLSVVTAAPSKVLSAVARHSFFQRFRDYEVIIANPLAHAKPNVPAKTIIIYTTETGKVMLKHFGGVIQNLVLHYQDSELINYINRYASDSLITLELNYLDDNILSDFTKPFPRLEGLKVLLGNRVNSDNLTFQQMFPNLRHLNVNWLQDFITVNLPHLVSLELSSVIGADLTKFRKMLRINPQIRILGLNAVSQDISNAIAQYVPHIERLHVRELSSSVNIIQLNHVKDFVIGSYYDEPIHGLTFPNLELLSVRFEPADTGRGVKWENFVKRHNKLTFLQLRNADFLNLAAVTLPLFRQLPHLIEANLMEFYPTLGDVAEIFQRCPKLVKLSISFIIGPQEQELFLGAFGNNWNNWDEWNNGNIWNVKVDELKFSENLKSLIILQFNRIE